MVKRKDSLSDKKEKIKKAGDAVRKVSKKVNFEEMYDAFTVDGPLIPLKFEGVYFERHKESKPIVSVGVYTQHYDDGTVYFWDETHNESYGFNYKKDLHLVKCRVPYLPPPEALQEQPIVPEVVATVPENEEPEEGPSEFKLWVDDERDPPDDSWVIARTSQEAIEMVVMVGGMPHVMGLDHDLGLKPDGTLDTVPHFLKWMAETAQPDDVIPEYTVHSQNPSGAANIVSFMESWKKSRTL